MMILVALGIIVLVVLVLIGAFLIVQQTGSRRRSADDIVDLLLDVNESIQDVEVWLSPSAQQQLKALSINDTKESKICYRRDVHALLDRLYEFFSRMKRDVTIVSEVANTEYCYMREKKLEYSDEVRRALHDVVSASNQFQRAIRVPLMFLGFWKRVPLDKWMFVPVPRLASFGQFRGSDVLAAYRRVKEASLAMSSLVYPGVGAIRETIQQRM
jgi:hypothetical protein